MHIDYPKNFEQISDDFVLGDEDTFLNVEVALNRLDDIGFYNLTDRIIIIECWIVDALCAQPLARPCDEPPRNVDYDCDPIADQRMDASDFEY
jgi:hypothetical protein